jgi:MFS family permease
MADSNSNLTGRLLLVAGVTLFGIGQSLNFIIVGPMARATGLSEVQFGLALTLGSLPLVFSAAFWGRRSDVVGRKPVFVIGLIGSGIGTWLLAFVLSKGLAGALSVTGILLGITLTRAFYGATSAAIYPSAAGYMADVTTMENRAKGMALIGSANSLGAILGPLLAAGLAFAGLLVPLYAAATFCLMGALAAALMLREPDAHTTARRKGSDLRFWDPRLRPYLIIWACFFLVFISLNVLTAFFIQDQLGVDDEKRVVRIASLMLISMAVVITVVQGVILQIWRVSPRLLLRLCGPAFVVALLLIGFATNVPMLATGFAFFGLSFALATPGINGSASLAMKPNEQGAAAGYLSASNTVGAIAAPVVGTAVYQLAPNAPFLGGAALFFVISLYALTIKVQDPTATPKPSAA